MIFKNLGCLQSFLVTICSVLDITCILLVNKIFIFGFHNYLSSDSRQVTRLHFIRSIPGVIVFLVVRGLMCFKHNRLFKRIKRNNCIT